MGPRILNPYQYETFGKQVESLLSTCYANAQKYSLCCKKKVGSVLFPIDNLGYINNMSIFFGWGGASEKHMKTRCPLDFNGECGRKTVEWTHDTCWSVHSEQRAIMNALSTVGHLNRKFNWVMLVTHGPCDQCIKFMHHVGVDNCFFDVDYKTDYSKWKGKVNIMKLEDLYA